MRRVTVEEAARCLDVNEDVVRSRIKDGQLVACQDLEFRGYVWLRDIPEPPPEQKAESKTPSKGRKPRSTKQSQDVQAPPLDSETNGNSPSKGRKPRSAQQSPDVQDPPLDGETNGKAPGKERKARAAEQSPEVQLLQETVAMLKAELENKDRQLELKDAEIQVRREEFKELLVIMQQNRALPAPASGSRDPSESIFPNLKAAWTRAVARVAGVYRGMLSHFSHLIFRNKGSKSAGEKPDRESGYSS